MREILVKRELRKIGRDRASASGRFIPHITLVYPFALKWGVKPFHLMEKLRDTSQSFGRLPFRYGGLISKNVGDRAITVFEVIASEDLKEFRFRIYQSIKNMILEDPSDSAFNRLPADRYWFHATVSMKSGLNMIDRLKEFFNPAGNVESEVVRICLLRSRRIVYEYDHTSNLILNRRQALRRTI